MKLKLYTKKIDTDKYIAHILDYDLITYGKTEDDAIKQVLTQLKLYKECVKMDIENGVVDAKYKRPAPLRYYLDWHFNWWLFFPVRLLRDIFDCIVIFLDLSAMPMVNSKIIHYKED